MPRITKTQQIIALRRTIIAFYDKYPPTDQDFCTGCHALQAKGKINHYRVNCPYALGEEAMRISR